MLTYLMVSRVAQLCPGAVLTKLDKLVDPLKLTVTTKVKANAVKQEYEKQDELKRSAMRAIAALMHVPGAGNFWNFIFQYWKKCLIFREIVSDKHPQLNDFLNTIKSTPDLANLFESIQKDASSGMDTFGMAMDISWRGGRREAGHGEAASSAQAFMKGTKRVCIGGELKNGSAPPLKIAKVK